MKNKCLYQNVFLPTLKTVVSSCPFPLQKKIAESLLARVFAETRRDGDLDFLTDRCIGIVIDDINYQAAISLQSGQLTLSTLPPSNRTQTDALIRGDLSAFIQLANRSEDPDSLFFQRRLCIEGDTDLALEVKNLLDALDIDGLPLVLQKALSLTQLVDQKGFNYGP